MYGTYEAFRYKVPGLHKVRYIGQVSGVEVEQGDQCRVLLVLQHAADWQAARSQASPYPSR